MRLNGKLGEAQGRAERGVDASALPSWSGQPGGQVCPCICLSPFAFFLWVSFLSVYLSISLSFYLSPSLYPSVSVSVSTVSASYLFPTEETSGFKAKPSHWEWQTQLGLA